MCGIQELLCRQATLLAGQQFLLKRCLRQQGVAGRQSCQGILQGWPVHRLGSGGAMKQAVECRLVPLAPADLSVVRPPGGSESLPGPPQQHQPISQLWVHR